MAPVHGCVARLWMLCMHGGWDGAWWGVYTAPVCVGAPRVRAVWVIACAFGLAGWVGRRGVLWPRLVTLARACWPRLLG